MADALYKKNLQKGTGHHYIRSVSFPIVAHLKVLRFGNSQCLISKQAERQ